MRAAQIILIEDNAADVLLVELALKENRIAYEMKCFKNGREAVDALCATDGTSANAPRPDAILLDLNTPKSDGFEVLGKLKRDPNLAGVPIAVITSSQARNDIHRTSHFDSVLYIQKSSQVEVFFRTVGRAVREMLRSCET